MVGAEPTSIGPDGIVSSVAPARGPERGGDWGIPPSTIPRPSSIANAGLRPRRDQLASPKGGQPPIDPKSDLPENQTPAMTRFKQDERAQKALASTRKLAEMKAEDYDSVFYVGGHGPMWDLVDNPDSIHLIESFYDSGKPVAAVCHSPAVFHRAKHKGAPLVKGKRVTGFTNGEEEAFHLTRVVPFLVEDELKRVGGLYEKAADWESFAIVDERVITGQNPASSSAAASSLVELLEHRHAA
jgi:putative intracellular protease/amidase